MSEQILIQKTDQGGLLIDYEMTREQYELLSGRRIMKNIIKESKEL